MVITSEDQIVKAGNDMAGVLLEIDALLRHGIPLTQELSLSVMEMIDLAVDHWKEAVAPPEEV
jgi:hypothetical protein